MGTAIDYERKNVHEWIYANQETHNSLEIKTGNNFTDSHLVFIIGQRSKLIENYINSDSQFRSEMLLDAIMNANNQIKKLIGI